MREDANGMMIEHLKGITAYELALKIIIILMIISIVMGLAYKTWKLLERYREAVNKFEEKNDLLDKHTEDIKRLQNADSALSKEVKAIDVKIDNITSQLQFMQEKSDSRERARIKSRISSLYQHFHETQSWNCMEKESMEDLIASYEECGGENSFIHEIVQKEMYTWEIIEQ